jgi:hypothetical protein
LKWLGIPWEILVCLIIVRNLDWLPPECKLAALPLQPAGGEIKHYLTPGSKMLEELIVFHLLKKFRDFYGTVNFITAFISSSHWTLSLGS